MYQTTSQVVAPRAWPILLALPGSFRTSRITEAMKGMVYRQDNAGAEDADAEWRTAEKPTDNRQPAQGRGQGGLNMLGKDWHKDQETPHPINDTGNSGQKFDGNTQRTA
ncbi:hypothetical protein CCP3SC15_2340008 [Gammaproteobacteria bacterium]